jgi:signal transduction histidine kinase
MLRKLPRLLREYRAALRRYLKGAPFSDLSEAGKLGLRALKIGLETLDLARLHEEALIVLVLKHPDVRNDDMVRLAGTFFAEAITPIEGSHRAAREKNIQLKAAVDKLSQRSVELAESNKELKREIQRRVQVERNLKISETTTSELLKESLLLQQELRFLSRRLLTAQEEERKRISRELHDVVAQTLTGINIRLAALTLQTHANSTEIHEKIEITQRLVEQSVDIVHRFARDLRPTVLDDLGLIAALKSYLNDFTSRSGIMGSLNAFPSVEKLTSEEKTVLYRVAQEALVNITRHSKATRATVTIRKSRDGVRMQIHDDGKGFKVSARRISKGSERLGLLGMRERVEMVGGRFYVESEPGKGTTIQADLPLKLSTGTLI